MVQLPRAFLQENEFRASVDRIAQSLAPDVERIITSLDYNWDNEPVAWLFVIVSDEVYQRGQTHEVMNQARKLIDEQIDPHEWGLWTLPRVRTHSEQADLERRGVA
jgi:hypothetical protein